MVANISPDPYCQCTMFGEIYLYRDNDGKLSSMTTRDILVTLIPFAIWFAPLLLGHAIVHYFDNRK